MSAFPEKKNNFLHPQLGRLPTLSNAFVNVGPGFNGWKICVGAGQVNLILLENIVFPNKSEVSVCVCLFGFGGQTSRWISRKFCMDPLLGPGSTFEKLFSG